MEVTQVTDGSQPPLGKRAAVALERRSPMRALRRSGSCRNTAGKVLMIFSKATCLISVKMTLLCSSDVFVSPSKGNP